MLIKQIDLAGIKAGSISIAFRKWKRPSVKKGTLLKTAIGQVEVLDISEITEEEITEKELFKAGYSSRQELLQKLQKWNTGILYRIELRYHSPDPRIELRNNTDVTEEEFQKIKAKLERLDKFSKRGHWTIKVLVAIKENPELKAIDLAAKMDMEKDWLKPNVRKLKGLGLTISHGIGYSLSPRGQVVLDRMLE